MIFFLLLLLLFTTNANATQLSDVVAATAIGTWTKFSPSNKTPVADDGNWAGFDGSAVWDPTSGKFMHWGSAGHTSGYRFVVYTESTGAWSLGPNLPGGFGQPFGHGNDQQTIDPLNQRYYVARTTNDSSGSLANPPEIYRLQINTGTWTLLPLPASGSTEIVSLTWFPERNRLIFVREGGVIQEFNEATQTWANLPGANASGANYFFSEYSPKCACVVIMNTAGQIRKLSAAGTISNGTNTPISIYSGLGWWGHIVLEPVTGSLLIVGDAAGGSPVVRIYDPVADSYTTTTNPPSTFTRGTVHTPVSTYGVILFAQCGVSDTTCTDADMWVFKYAAMPTPEEDFANRCGAFGVTACYNFTASEIAAHSTPAPSTGLSPTEDTTVKTSGNGSMRIRSPNGGPASNYTGGHGDFPFNTNCGPGTTCYVQHRFRVNQALMDNQTAGRWHVWKWSIIHGVSTGTCSDLEITGETTHAPNQAAWYTNCGSRAFGGSPGAPYTMLNPGWTIIQQTAQANSGYNCDYDAGYPAGIGNGVGCFYFVANTWYTIDYKIQTGAYGAATSNLDIWITKPGDVRRQVVHMVNWVQNYQNSASDVGYNNFYPIIYDTDNFISTVGDSDAWYDELIVSTQPIALPGSFSAPAAPSPSRPTALKVTSY